MISSKILGSKQSVVCARAGGANTTPLFSVAHFAKRNTKFGGGIGIRVGLKNRWEQSCVGSIPTRGTT